MNWELILKYVNTETTAAENSKVEQWLDENEQNPALLAYLQKRRLQLQQPLKQADIDEQWLLLLNRIFELPASRKVIKPRNLYLSVGIAASLLLVSLTGLLYLKQQRAASRDFTLQTSATNRGKVTLPDGTEVFMAPASKIIYKGSYGLHKRELQLTGEAFFKVKHRQEVPFIIHTPNRVTVTVLGTSFNVYNRSTANTEVKVATGLVGVTANNRTSLLKAGQQASYTVATGQLTINRVDEHDAAALQNETLFFKNNTADEIAQKLQRWYNINVKVQPSARRHARFSGELKDDGITTVLKALNYATGLHYRYSNSNTLLLF